PIRRYCVLAPRPRTWTTRFAGRGLGSCRRRSRAPSWLSGSFARRQPTSRGGSSCSSRAPIADILILAQRRDGADRSDARELLFAHATTPVGLALYPDQRPDTPPKRASSGSGRRQPV